jgi:hypothetical protein
MLFSQELCYLCIPAFRLSIQKTLFYLLERSLLCRNVYVEKNSGIAVCGSGMIYFGSKSYLLSHS